MSPRAAPAELNPPRILFPAPPPPPPPLGEVVGPIPKKDDSLEVVEGGGIGMVFPLSVLVTVTGPCCVPNPWLLEPCVLPETDPDDRPGAPAYENKIKCH